MLDLILDLLLEFEVVMLVSQVRLLIFECGNKRGTIDNSPLSLGYLKRAVLSKSSTFLFLVM